MIIYRLEHPRTRKGPYNSKNTSLSWQTGNHNKSDKKNPTPFVDFKRKDSQLFYREENFLCGFSSLEQLNKWFNKTELKRLKDSGFKIYKINVDGRSKILKGEKQVAFRRKFIISKEKYEIKLK